MISIRRLYASLASSLRSASSLLQDIGCVQRNDGIVVTTDDQQTVLH